MRRLIPLLCALMLALAMPIVRAEDSADSFASFYRIPDTLNYKGGMVQRGYLAGADTTAKALQVNAALTSSCITPGQSASWKVAISGGTGEYSCSVLLAYQDLSTNANSAAWQVATSLRLSGNRLTYTFAKEGRYFWEFRVMDEDGQYVSYQTRIYETGAEVEEALPLADDVITAQTKAANPGPSEEQSGFAEDQVELLSEGKYPPKGMSRVSRGDMSAFNTLIMTELEALSEYIDVSSFRLTRDEFREAYRGLLNSHPEFFYVSGGYRYYYSGNIVTKVLPTYKYSAEELPAKIALYNRELNKIINYASKASSTIGKLLLANDYLCVNYEYDEPARENHSPEEMFETGRGVCNAYTLIYVAVCNRFGITNTTATSDAMNHIWNVVNLGGSWYHVDVTWNDPIADTPYRARHRYFLLSDAGMNAANHYDWVTSERATNTKYDNYFWQDIEHAVSLHGNQVYFTPNNNGYPAGVICTGNLSNGTVTEVLHYTVNLHSIYYRDHNPVWATSDTVYFGMADDVYAMPLTGGTPQLVFSANDTSEYMAYMYLSGNTMYVTARSLNDYSPTVYSFKIGSTLTVTLDASRFAMKQGDSKQLSYTTTPATTNASVSWSTSDSSVATVNSSGLVTAVSPGAATITVKVGSATAACTVVVISNTASVLPASLEVIEDEAFENCTYLRFVKIPGSVTYIGEDAFEECTNLTAVCIPASVRYIGEDAFEDCPLQYAEVSPGSYAAEWLLKHFPDIILVY